MEIAKEDLQRIRELLAEKGKELTPKEVLTILRKSKDIEVVDRPGLVTRIRQLREKKE